MTSLLSRLPSLGAAEPGERRGPASGWLAGAAALAVSVLGLLGLGLALVVVQTLDPDGGLPVGSSARLAGQLWLLGQGAQLQLTSGPLRLAPLVLTLLIAWGLSRAAGSVVTLQARHTPAEVAPVLGVVVAVHVAVTAVLALLVDAPGAGVDVLRAVLAALVVALLAAGWGVLRDSGLGAELVDRFPGPGAPSPRRCSAARSCWGPAAPPSSPWRWSTTSPR